MAESNLQGEIHAQPKVLAGFLQGEGGHVAEIVRDLRKREIEYVTIAARGTSDNAATYGKYIFAALNRMTTAQAAPSLYTIYHRPPSHARSLVIAISQSGESPDILAVLQEARRQGAPTVAITNGPDSAMAREAEHVILMNAGEEKSVAATKTYTTSLAALALLAATWRGDPARLAELDQIPGQVARALEIEPQAVAAVGRLAHLHDCTVIARGLNYATAFELSLKLKELAYVHAEPYSSADFLHGPMALVDEAFRAIVVAPRGEVYAGLVEFAGRLRREGARLISISDNPEMLRYAEVGLELPEGTPEWLSPIVAIIPGQLFVMHLAQAKGYDLDHPRSLSKITRTV